MPLAGVAACAPADARSPRVCQLPIVQLLFTARGPTCRLGAEERISVGLFSPRSLICARALSKSIIMVQARSPEDSVQGFVPSKTSIARATRNYCVTISSCCSKQKQACALSSEEKAPA